MPRSRRKVDSTDAAALAGAEFAVWRDGGDGTFGGAAAGSGDVLVTSVTTSATGTASVSGLRFGTYFVQETKAPTAAPAGYVLPTGDAALSAVVAIDASNAGTAIAAVTFADVAESVTGGIEDEDDLGQLGTDEGEAVVAGTEDSDESLASTGAGGAVGLAAAALAMIGAGAFLATTRRRGTSA